MKRALFTMVCLAAWGAAGHVAAGTLDDEVLRGLEDARVRPDARVTVVGINGARASSCVPDRVEVARPVDRGGRYAVRAIGRGCSGWLWVQVEVRATVMIVTRPLRAGEPLAVAVRAEEAPVTAGAPLGDVALGAVAARALRAGQVLQESDVRAPTLALGSPVKVMVRTGALVLEQAGRISPCPRGRTCATLPSGKHVEGQLVDGRLLVDVP